MFMTYNFVYNIQNVKRTEGKINLYISNIVKKKKK